MVNFKLDLKREEKLKKENEIQKTIINTRVRTILRKKGSKNKIYRESKSNLVIHKSE